MTKFSRLSTVAIGLLIMLFALTGVAEAASASCGTWRVVASPNASPNSNSLRAVAALSSTNVWAAGSDLVGTSKASLVYQTLMEHFNGSSWSIISSPNVGTGNNALNGIAAVSTSNIYAVGSSDASTGGQQTLVLHYDGSSWSVVTTPNAGPLKSIAVVSATNIYALGGGTAILHFNGTGWSVTAAPHLRTFDNLNAIAAVSATNIWAVGITDDYQTVHQTLIEHFNGSSWSIVSSPNPLSNDVLNAITVVSATNIWAVGSDSTHFSDINYTLVEHFNGSSWKAVASPNLGTGTNLLLGVTAISAINVVAVGVSYTNGDSSAIIERWNGTSWKFVANPKQPVAELNASARLPGTSQLWAVGDFAQGTLTETNC
ncbi:MAG: hypothetical protein NVSMB33_12020 [Ktedonobacteraceae bacterium]